MLVSLGDTGGGISRDDFIDKVANGILGKLPPEYDMDIIRKNYGLQISPTTVVLLQELERFNRLIKKMRTSLSTLRRVSMPACVHCIYGYSEIGHLKQAPSFHDLYCNVFVIGL